MVYKVGVIIPDEFYVEADTVEETFDRAAYTASFKYFTWKDNVKYVSSKVVDSVSEDTKIYF